MFFDHTVTFVITDILEIHRNEKATRTSGRDIHVLSYRLSGYGEIFSNGETYLAKNGDVLSIPPNLDYSQRTRGEHLIAVHLETFREKPDIISTFHTPDPAQADRVFLNLLRIWTERKPGYQYRATAMLAEFLADIQQLRACRAEESAQIAAAVHFIHQQYTNAQLKVADVARHVNFSEVHFRRLFTRVCGQSPLAYIVSQRIALACRLLRGGGFSVGEVAAQAGFPDVKYFSVCFKKHTGFSPSSYIEESPWRQDGES